MNRLAQKEAIEESLKGFSSLPLEQASLKLFDVLGYRSEKRLALRPNNADTFLETFVHQRPFNKEQALVDEWETVDFLFQITDDEIQSANQGSLQFSSKGTYEGANIESYLFFAIALKKSRYTRTQLSAITRAVNRLFSMPVMLLFRHEDTITLSIIRRRIDKRDESKDVLEKVTLIKDIRFTDPLRAHIEILNDLALSVLYDEFYFHNFAGLHQAWEKRLETYALNKRFYREIADWYFWASQHSDIVYPRDVKTEDGRSIFLIRLLTRLIFCWFLQEKGLIPRDLFRGRIAEKMLNDFSPKTGTYYRAFLQNLFFGTLNQSPEKRGFRLKAKKFPDPNRGVTNLYRYANLLKKPEDLLEMFKSVPFVNGGLFDCLDVVYQEKEGKPNVRLDDFSEEKKNLLCIPNELFFGEERELDLSDVYGDKRKKREKVSGLIEIMSRYKFTVEENTPFEQEIALDPELLGKVFENLLASYNEDTRTTARKATGSFYTPREIVTFMVDEALITYLNRVLTNSNRASANPPERVIPAEAGIQEESERKDSEARLRQVFSVAPEHFQNSFSGKETEAIIHAIDGVKILDPACGSGAFLMGALHRLVDLLQKFDPQNKEWRDIQRRKAIKETEEAYKIGDKQERQSRLIEIDEIFEQNASDYGRKLYLIENCIYGVDIQPIACQIAKLRFFIALIVDQNVNAKALNFGVRPLPNLETKIVAANALISAGRAEWHQQQLFQYRVREVREELERIRHDYFNARSPGTKARCRKRDAELRQKLADLLTKIGMPDETSKMLSTWDPYDQNTHADFFDPEWMFGLSLGKLFTNDNSCVSASAVGDRVKQLESKDMEIGFDVVIANPPYVNAVAIKDQKPRLKQTFGDFFNNSADLYTYFYKRSYDLLNEGGILSYISSNKFMRSGYGHAVRGLLAEKAQLNLVVDFGEMPVFGAGIDVAIIIASKPRQNGPKVEFIGVVIKEPSEIDRVGEIVHDRGKRFHPSELKADGWLIESSKVRKILQQIQKAGEPLGSYVKGNFYRGILTGFNDAFVINEILRDSFLEADRKLKSIIKPWLDGNEILRWHSAYSHQYLLAIPSSVNCQWPWSNCRTEAAAEKIFADTYPCLYKHLLQFKNDLRRRSDQGNFWWELRACSYWDEFDSPKIVFNETSKELHAFVDYDALCINKTGFIIRCSENEFILGMLNSRVIDYLCRHTFPAWGDPWRGGRIQFRKERMVQVPIPQATATQKSQIKLLVDYLQWLYRQPKVLSEREANPRDPLMLGYFEQIVNGLVYELFFPEELQAARLSPFSLIEEAKLPKIEDISESSRLPVLRNTFEQIYDTNHPIRGCLFSVRSIEAVGIIEGQ